MFKSFAPLLFEHYRTNLELLRQWKPTLAPAFVQSVFAACTFNFGPQTVSILHRDKGNIVYGWCGITALGHFNPDYGGHLILWDVGLVIRFPPGSTILIPSAAITHSNVPICKGETRYSFIQYSAGGLFRWVYNGFMKDEDFEAQATKEEMVTREKDRRERWNKGLDMFMKLPTE